MVITSLGDGKIITVITVDVVGTVVHVGWIESAHAGGTTEDSVAEFQTFKSMALIEEFGSDGHRNRKIGAELVVRPFIVRFIKILVNPATVDGTGIHVVQGIFFAIYQSAQE